MKPTKHLIDEIKNILDHLPELMKEAITADNLIEKRKAYGLIAAEMARDQPVIEGIETLELSASNSQDNFKVPLFFHRPTNFDTSLPCLLWIHGGGYIIGSAESDAFMAKQIAKVLNCAVAVVDYRLAPEHPYPLPLQDCFAVLNYIFDNTESLNLDAKKIAVLGISAGAGLAAGLTLLNRDEAGNNLCGQVLLYPMLDDKNILAAKGPDDNFLIWPRESNLFGWQSYLGKLFGGADVPPYAAAARSENLAGLPKALVIVGDLDLFVQEDITYALELINAGVPTDLHVYSGGCHSFDKIAPESLPGKRSSEEVEIFLSEIFSSPIQKLS